MQLPQRLRGMEDSAPEVARAMTRVGQGLADLLADYGYLSVDVPILEVTELFLRKSGGELASRMYTFVDPGGHRVSIRPEFTSSVVRAYLEGLNRGPLPLRWQYQGPVLRYERDVEGSRRQHIQVGAELIGASGPWADAEVLALACMGLSSLGISGHSLVVGHLGFIGALLESLGLSDRARLFLLASVSSLKEEGPAREQVYRRASSLGLLPVDGQEAEPPSALAGEEAMALLERLAESDEPAVGVRGPEEIRERYMRKQRQPDDPARFSDALDTVAKVVRVQGRPEEAVRQVRGLLPTGSGQQELDSLERAFEALSGYGLQIPVTLDFGLARGIAYYSGTVFEIQHPAIGDAPSLGGGGRYDGLVQALGGVEETPAMGFAWTLDRVVQALAADGAPITMEDDRTPEVVLVRAQEPAAHGAAVKEAERLRAQGNVVESEVSQRSLDECLRYARERGVRRVVSVSAGGEVQESDVPEQ